ncbi:MAG: hypothetical protein JKX70_11715 [Phycisphaerales bacterium]|nr:hypothetical protein [Phycisphaerales bacterium]
MSEESDSRTHNLVVPKTSKGDVGHAIAKGVIGSVPVLGSAGAELFSFVVSAPIEKRRNEWMEQVGERLRTLESDRGLSLEELQQDEEFIDMLIQASTIALRTSQQEKQEALLNAISNSTSSTSIQSAIKQMYLRLIDDFNEWHIRLLKLFSNPPQWFSEHGVKPPQNITMGSLELVLKAAYPELKTKRAFYDQVWRDLNVAGLVSTDSLQGGMSGQGMMQLRASERGKEFLWFIQSQS